MQTKKLTNKFLFTLFTILIFHISHSQENYLPGYIIKTTKDTIHGFVDYKNWSVNPNKITFKKKTDQQAKTYNQTNIIEFSVKDEIYVSAIVKRETSPVQTNILQDYPELNIKLDTVFLQTLFKGSKNLYYHKSIKGRDNFYIKRGNDFVLLMYKKYTSYGLLKENKKYKGQLDLYLSDDCPSTRLKLAYTEYTQKSLEKLFQHYYNCSQEEIIFQKKKEKVSADIGVLAGISLSKLEFNGKTSLNYLTETDFSQSTDFTSGIFIDIFFSRNLQKWSLNNELIYSQAKYEGRHHSFRNETGDVNTLVQFDYSYIKLNNLLRFNIPLNQKSLRAFINLGISNGFAIKEKNYKKQEINFFGNERVVEEKALDRSRKYEQSYILGAGIKHKKLSLEARHERGNGISEFENLSSPTKRIYILLGYRF
ncbi:hypothetical protein [Hwangdonia lutea]|uniref:Outer membrane protein beta-barrel domain-containing protein n=1 Tax=Hwangdonia lutea TaxID=3075823 RepID=A0AA97HRD9_9FLAO|nr:hypothetical protein [Hwangdonia sp. SCSIO 19198]WOD44821.1 hypothetical protein RNZ46_06035 [Hwangdonia sp. SCSIO 19198]